MRYDAGDRLTSIEQQLHDVQDELARVPIKAAVNRDTTVTIILGKAIGDVATTDATFDVDEVDLIIGIDPREDDTDTTETVTIKNTFGQAYASSELVIAFQREDNDAFEVEKVGSGSSQLIHFELTEDKGTADVAKLARSVNSNGTLDMVGSDFYVLDNSARYYGKAAWSVVGPPAASDRGYRGYAEFREADYNLTGRAGFDIVEMEQPTMGFLCSLDEVTPITAPKTYTVDQTDDYILEPLEQQGEGRWPKDALDSLTDWVVEDLGSFTPGGSLERAIIMWSTDEGKYLVAGVNTNYYVMIQGETKTTVSDTEATFDIYNIETLIGDDPRTDPSDAAESVTVINDPVINAANGDTVRVMYDRKAGVTLGTQWRTAIHDRPLQKIIIKSNIAAATYTVATKAIAPVTFTATLLEMVGGAWKDNGTTRSARSYYLTAITVTSGSARFGYIDVYGELVILDCTEFSLS